VAVTTLLDHRSFRPTCQAEGRAMMQVLSVALPMLSVPECVGREIVEIGLFRAG
jgi:hypothetical protein